MKQTTITEDTKMKTHQTTEQTTTNLYVFGVHLAACDNSPIYYVCNDAAVSFCNIDSSLSAFAAETTQQ